MRSACHFLLTSVLLSLPAIASAQGYYAPAPAYVPAPPPPQVYFPQRIRWRFRRHFGPAQVYVTPSPPPVWVAPGAPPPPVYVTPPPVVVQPQQPIYVEPQPVYAPPPVYPPPAPAPAPVVTIVNNPPAKPDFVERFGFGATVEGLFTVDNGDNKGFGILGQLRYRVARHLGLELMAGYERSHTAQDQLHTDVPVTFGLLIPFIGPEHILSPYLVGAAGLNFADLRLIDGATLQLDDSRTQLVGQVGGGLELRLGQHFALNGDVRLEYRYNLNGPSDAVANTKSIDGKPVDTIQNSLG
jgi:hypothetical protein